MEEAQAYADEMQAIWGDDVEQIEAHMEGEGFSDHEINTQLRRLGHFPQCNVYALSVI